MLAIATVGLLIWAPTTRSDLDRTQQQLDNTEQELASANQELCSTKQQLDSAKQYVAESQSQGDESTRTGGVLAAAKVLYDEFAEQLDATNEDITEGQDASGIGERRRYGILRGRSRGRAAASPR